jgi:hypothetical protein
MNGRHAAQIQGEISFEIPTGNEQTSAARQKRSFRLSLFLTDADSGSASQWAAGCEIASDTTSEQERMAIYARVCSLDFQRVMTFGVTIPRSPPRL